MKIDKENLKCIWLISTVKKNVLWLNVFFNLQLIEHTFQLSFNMEIDKEHFKCIWLRPISTVIGTVLWLKVFFNQLPIEHTFQPSFNIKLKNKTWSMFECNLIESMVQSLTDYTYLELIERTFSQYWNW